jgi:hypothetical protein
MMGTMRRKILLAGLAAVVVAAGCTDRNRGGGVTDPPAPGVLAATLSTPNTDDRALIVELSGPGITAVQAAAGSGHTVHSRASGSTVRAALFGDLTDGAVLRFSVPDVSRANAYTARVVEASGADNSLREDVTGYRLQLARQP